MSLQYRNSFVNCCTSIINEVNEDTLHATNCNCESSISFLSLLSILEHKKEFDFIFRLPICCAIFDSLRNEEAIFNFSAWHFEWQKSYFFQTKKRKFYWIKTFIKLFSLNINLLHWSYFWFYWIFILFRLWSYFKSSQINIGWIGKKIWTSI